MPMRGENWRFWLPVVLLGIFSAYCSQKLLRAHITPQVDSPNYDFARELPGCRGSIFDANNSPLAKSVPFWEYRLDPVALTNRAVRVKDEKTGVRRPRTREESARILADALELPYDRVLAMAKDVKNRYQFLAISSDPVAHDAIVTNQLGGVCVEERQVRHYLQQRRFSHVIGSVNAANVGSAGIEQRYNRELTGVPGKIRGKKDALGHEINDKRVEEIAPIPGADIYLTVDNNVQYEVEESLRWGVGEFGAGSGWCVVMDSRTGAIRALASLPDFEPSVFGRAPEAARLNRVTGLTYEPGSVMKVITAAAAVDAKVVTPDTRYSTNRADERYYRLPGDGTHVWEPFMTIRDAIVHSSNIVIGKLGSDLGPQRLWTYMRRFGFGERTGIELPGEEVGILPDWQRWDRVKWSRAPIGQGVSVTAIQLCSAYQAIANDGLRMKPHIVDRIVGSDQTVLYRHTPIPAGRPIGAETARQVREMMLGVASPAGTARRAAIRGYSVAGKTGTAQKVVGGKYSDSLFRATFCGIVPASDPKLVILVTLDFDSRQKFHQGGNSAGPVFRRVALAALRYYMVPPDRPDEIDFDGAGEDEYDCIIDARMKKSAPAP